MRGLVMNNAKMTDKIRDIFTTRLSSNMLGCGEQKVGQKRLSITELELWRTVRV